jgi:glycosyltransferase involved in cell wall biosynthesis
MNANKPPKVAVLIPCYNEALTIAKVVDDFRRNLPGSDIYVYDNNSNDGTINVAKQAGAIVRSESLQGKGNVVRRMFADIEADVYVMVDGDATYDADSAALMIDKLVADKLDMVTGVRKSHIQEAYRAGHRMGNKLFSLLIAKIFGDRISDLLSGYRVFSRRFVKSFPALSGEFEIETELTVHALELRMPIAEVETPYGARPEGSVSKLSTYKDGVKILFTVLKLVKNERPLTLFGCLGLALFLISLLLAAPLLTTYLETGLVPRLPTALLVVGINIIGVFSIFSGIIIDSISNSRREMKRLFYLTYRSVDDGQDLA